MNLRNLNIREINWQVFLQFDREKILDWFTSPTGLRASYWLVVLSSVIVLLTFFGQIYDVWSIHATNWSKVAQLQPRVKNMAVSKPVPLAQYHLFGIDAETLRIATGNLELHGVFVSTIPTLSTAVIAQIGSEENTYQVNEVLPDGSKLLKVTDDHVSIERNGLIENLFLPADEQVNFDAPEEGDTNLDSEENNLTNADNENGPESSNMNNVGNEEMSSNPQMRVMQEIRKMGLLNRYGKQQ